MCMLNYMVNNMMCNFFIYKLFNFVLDGIICFGCLGALEIFSIDENNIL
jgi:hypothetical protein